MLTKNLTRLASQQSKLLGNNMQYSFARQSFADKMKQKNSVFNQDLQASEIASEFTTKDFLASNVGLNAFVNRVYKATGGGITAALSTSYFASHAPFVYMHPYMTLFGGLAMTIGGIFGASAMTPKYHVDNLEGAQALRTTNSPGRIALYGMGMAGLGLSFAPMMGMFNMVNPAIIPTSIVLSASIFGSASLYAYTRPKDSLISWGSSLYSALFGMIGLQLVGGVTQMVIGPNMFSSALHRVDTFVGVGIFSALVAYDTHVAIQSYENGNADHLMTSIDFALDFWNIFVRVSQILYMFSRND